MVEALFSHASKLAENTRLKTIVVTLGANGVMVAKKEGEVKF